MFKRFNLNMTDVEAVQAINKLPKSHRTVIGRLIWWDWFGQNLVKNRTSAFDHWINVVEKTEPTPEALKKSLMKLGYPGDLAWARVRPKGAKKLN